MKSQPSINLINRKELWELFTYVIGDRSSKRKMEEEGGMCI